MIIDRLSDDDLNRMRQIYASERGECETRNLGAVCKHLSDRALIHVAKGRIRFLSLAAAFCAYGAILLN